MNDIQKLPDQVHWYEGMLLSPQHFQQNNYYLEQLFFYHIKTAQPNFWGIKRLEIDENTISHDMLSVTAVEAIMPDGTVVREGCTDTHYPEQQKSDSGETPVSNLCIELSKIVDIQPQQPFFVYLCIPNMTDACASDEETDFKRYDSVKFGNVIDHNSIQNRIDLVRLRPRIQLIAEPQYSQIKYSGFPLFKVEKTYDGSFRLMEFTPPVLRIKQGARSFAVELTDKIEKTIADVRSKAKGIRDYFTDNKSQTSLVSSLQKQKIYHLTAQLPAFEALFYTQEAHPFQLYQTLIQVAAHMAILQDSLLPPKFAKYQHDNLDDTFKSVIDFIQGISDSIRLDFTTVPFDIDEKGRFGALIDVIPEGGSLFISCKLAKGSSLDQLKAWILSASIASESEWEELRRVRTTGAKRTPINEFKKLNLIQGEGEVFVEISNSEGYLSPNERLFIRGADDSLAEHKPAMINWFVPREAGK